MLQGLGGGEGRGPVRTLVMAGHFEETFFHPSQPPHEQPFIIPICG